MIRFTFLLTLLLSFASLFAQAPRNVAERAQDHHQIARGEAELKRDIQELADYRTLSHQLAEAVERRELARARVIRQDLLAAMRREIAQVKNEVIQSQVEVSQSVRERNAEQRDVVRDRRQGQPIAATAERADRRDDQRDLRDDRRDREQAVQRLARMERIYQELTDYPLAWDNALARHRQQVVEFGDLMEADLKALKKELSEDHRELREDRRETRSDRRH